MKIEFLESSEINGMSQNLANFFPLGENGWGSWLGRTGINRHDFDHIVDSLKRQLEVAKTKKPMFQKYSIEKMVFMALWHCRLGKSFKECGETFDVKRKDVKFLIKYIVEFIVMSRFLFPLYIKKVFCNLQLRPH